MAQNSTEIFSKKIISNRSTRIPGGYGRIDQAPNIAASNNNVIGSDWLLVTHFWDDNGFWRDEATWID